MKRGLFGISLPFLLIPTHFRTFERQIRNNRIVDAPRRGGCTILLRYSTGDFNRALLISQSLIRSPDLASRGRLSVPG